MCFLPFTSDVELLGRALCEVEISKSYSHLKLLDANLVGSFLVPCRGATTEDIEAEKELIEEDAVSCSKL